MPACICVKDTRKFQTRNDEDGDVDGKWCFGSLWCFNTPPKDWWCQHWHIFCHHGSQDDIPTSISFNETSISLNETSIAKRSEDVADADSWNCLKYQCRFTPWCIICKKPSPEDILSSTSERETSFDSVGEETTSVEEIYSLKEISSTGKVSTDTFIWCPLGFHKVC